MFVHVDVGGGGDIGWAARSEPRQVLSAPAAAAAAAAIALTRETATDELTVRRRRCIILRPRLLPLLPLLLSNAAIMDRHPSDVTSLPSPRGMRTPSVSDKMPRTGHGVMVPHIAHPHRETYPHHTVPTVHH